MKKMLILLIIAVIGFTSCSPNKKEEPRYQHSSITPIYECTTLKVIEGSAVRKKKIMLTKSEQLIFATLLAYECGGSSRETKMAVASVVVNRMKLWGLTLRQTVFQKNVFSPAKFINQTTGENGYWSNGKRYTKDMTRGGRYEECWTVVEEICENGPSIPYYVVYFKSLTYDKKTGKPITFHTWAIPYKKIGSLYFSYSSKYM